MRYRLIVLTILMFLPWSISLAGADQPTFGYVDNNGVKIHYATVGSGPLVVMVHGFPDFWYTWRHQMSALAPQYQVVAMDLRGYNKSDKPQGVEHYKMRSLIGDVAAVIQHFPQKKAIVVGHDWGGAIAWQVATWRPDLVEKLIVLSTPHPSGLSRAIASDPEQKKNSQYARDFQKEGAHNNLTAEGLAGWVQDDGAKARYIEAFRRSDFEAMLNYYKASYPKPGSGGQSSQSPAPTKKVTCPTLAIFGLQDKFLLPAGWNGTWDQVASDLTLVSVPEGGHFVHHDAGEFVTSTMVQWLGAKPGSINPDAPVETAGLGRLLGDWDAYQVKRNRDGSWASDTTHSEWRWYAILDGHGIQDDWISLGKNEDGTPTHSVIGTNIRIYNPKEKQWHMAWIDKNNRRLASFTAIQNGDSIVMSGHNAQGRVVRNTFSIISPDAFDWQQEWTFDEGQTWVAVSKISCRRKR